MNSIHPQLNLCWRALKKSFIAVSLLSFLPSGILLAEDDPSQQWQNQVLTQLDGIHTTLDDIEIRSSPYYDYYIHTIGPQLESVHDQYLSNGADFNVPHRVFQRAIGQSEPEDPTAWYGFNRTTNHSQNSSFYDVIGAQLMALTAHQIMGNVINSGIQPERVNTYLLNLGYTNLDFRTMYENLWTNLPVAYRSNTIGSYGFGKVHTLTNGYENFTQSTDLPDIGSSSVQEAILYWLMRNAGEQYAQNRWNRMGGIWGNRFTRDQTLTGKLRDFVTNETYAPISFALFSDSDDYGENNFSDALAPGGYQFPIIPYPASHTTGSKLDYAKPYGLGSVVQAYALSHFSRGAEIVGNNDYSIDVDENSEYLDPLFQTFVSSYRDHSFSNLPDENKNPDGINTNYPLLYYEDKILPYTAKSWHIPPSIDQYRTYQLAKLINRTSLMAYVATNGYDSSISTTAVTKVFGVDTNEFDNLTNKTYMAQESKKYYEKVLGDGQDEKGVFAVSNYLVQVETEFNKLEESDSASIPFSINLKTGDADTINHHVDFSFPDVQNEISKDFGKLVMWVYRVLFFFLYVVLLRGEISYWVKTISVVQVDLPGGGSVRHTDWGDL